MAILFRILFTLGLLIFHVFVPSVGYEITTSDIETPLIFEASNENPSYILATDQIIYLNCHVTYTLDPKLNKDFQDKFYPRKDSEDDYEDDDDEENGEEGEIVEKIYQQQYENSKRKDNTKKKSTQRTTTGLPLRSKRDKRHNATSSTSKTLSSEKKVETSSEELSDDQYIELLYKEQYAKYDKGANKNKKNNSQKLTTGNISRQKRGHSNDDSNKHVHKKSRGQRRRIRKRSSDTNNNIEKFYDWYKDGILINKTFENETEKKFEFLPNGTLRINPSPDTVGRYHCTVKVDVKFMENFNKKQQKVKKVITLGPIISRSTLIEVPSLIKNEDQEGQSTYSTFVNNAIVITCPITSTPPANVTWSFNNKDLEFGSRYFLLSNGNLLIVKVYESDSGKYRCKATNQFIPKGKENSYTTHSVLTVSSRLDNDDNQSGNSLLSNLQSSNQKIKIGGNLILHCATRVHKGKKISWTFTPRGSDIPQRIPNTSNELKYVNVSAWKHDGIYNCSTRTDSQTFDVTILTPPRFTFQYDKSRSTSVAHNADFKCNVAGNPMPEVEWYKNGKRIDNNHVKYFEYPIGKIETIDPEDEGSYQCIARNEYGDAVNSMYLHIRKKELLSNVPQNPKCYPKNEKTVHVTFKQAKSDNGIQYFIAADNPRKFLAKLSSNHSELNTSLWSDNFDIDYAQSDKIIKPLRKFYLYMRSMTNADPNQNPISNKVMMTVSKLSKPIVCAAQGFIPSFSKSKKGISFTWDVSEVTDKITSFTIQFKNEENNSSIEFKEYIIGTYEKSPSLPLDDSNSLVKIPISTKEHEENGYKIYDVKIPGNVTGIFVINVQGLNIRILGSTNTDGSLDEQDYTYLQWFTKLPTDISVVPIVVTDVESRNAKITWNDFDGVDCAKICTHKKQTAISRESSKPNCETINIGSKQYNLKGLSPISDYDVVVLDCKNNIISENFNFQTKLDAHGPPTKATLEITKDSGLILHWDPPINPNGEIFHYAITWVFNNETNERNVTGYSFKFPNTTSSDRFNITIRAYGVAGYGNPLFINPDKFGKLPRNQDPNPQRNNNSMYMILIIFIVTMGLLILAIGYIVCRRHRYCKQNGIISSEQSSFQTPASPLGANIRMDEMNEMQTLISTSQTLMSNGRGDVTAPSIKIENPSNGGMNITENQKMLRTSTPTDDDTTDQICLESPPIKRDEILTQHQTNNDVKPSTTIDFGILEMEFSPPQNNTIATAIDIITKKDTRNGTMKVNGGNLSPYKSLQSSGNDPNTSSTPSSFESQRQLIGSNLCIGMYNNNNNNANSNIDRGSRVGKSSSIESEDDSEENLNDYDLNDSNLSNKPLNPITWDFRCPLVGPNG